MGLLDRLSGVQDVARITIRFGEDGNHRLVVERGPALPSDFQGPALNAALFLYYTAKSLHALGAGRAADELHQHIALSGAVLRRDMFESFKSYIDVPGECIGRLQVDRAGVLSINTTFRVPLADTNNYIIDSTLLMLSRAVESQATPALRNRLADAIEVLGSYYRTTADPSSLQTLRHAAVAAFRAYQASGKPDERQLDVIQLIRPRWRFAERPVCESVYRDGDKHVLVGGAGQSGLHAMAHVRLRTLETTGLPTSRTAVDAIESWVGVHDGFWPPEHEERFVIAAEAYMAKQMPAFQATAVDVPVELESAFAELYPMASTATSKQPRTPTGQITGRNNVDRTRPE